MSKESGQITVYDPSMAAQVAQMFNDFDELWPGGFGGGIPYDEQRVSDWLDDTSAIADLIAFDGDPAVDGAPVGYCGLYPHWRDENAAYVSILGVVPRVKGKKYGKRLLLKAIETARARGLQRVDLHTWGGNLNAVPLYKKIGMFWMPETSVYMQDYIPALAQTSLGQAWFEVHPDWYACFQREWAQVPDKHADEGFELYTYLFEAGEDRLVGEVDRYGWGICGMERVLDGEAISVKTRLREHDILIGLPNEMTITVENHTGRGLDLALTVEPFKGLSWEAPFPLSFSVPDGSSSSVSRTFVVDRTANARYDSHKASDTLRTRVILDGAVVDLVTGGKIQPAVRAASGHSYQVAPLGGTAEVCLDLVNHARQALRGQVDVFVEGVAGSRQQFEFALDAEERSGIVVPVPASADARDPVRVVHAVPSIETEDGARAMPAYRLALVADAPDLVAVVEANDGKSVRLLTDVLDIHAELEGGRVTVERRTLPGARQRLGFQAGPPFGISLDDTLSYTCETRTEGRACTLVLRATSRQFPDLRIEKHVRVRPGVREVEHWITLTNLRSDGPHTVDGRLSTGGGGMGISLDPFREQSRSFTPSGPKGTVVECDGMLPLMSDNMVPQEPDQWPETWTAVQTLTHGDHVAWFWRPAGISKVKVGGGMLSSLECEPRALAPGERAELFHAWYGFSYTSLPDVRNRWSQLVGHTLIPHDERYGVPTVPPIAVRWTDENVVVRGTRARKTIELAFATPFPLPGELRLVLPGGWQGAFLTPDGPQPTLAMPDPVPGAPAAIEIELVVPADAPTVVDVRLQFGGAFEMDFDLPLLTVGEGEVAVEQRELEGQSAFAVSNGALRFAVLDGLSGSLIRLQDARGRGYLYDNLPEVKPWFFFENHVGGVQPRVAGRQLEVIFDELDPLQAEPVEAGRWKGVEVWWTAYQDEHVRGQEFRLAALTLPGSDLVRFRLRHHNPTPRRVEWFGSLMANLALGDTPGGGSAEGTAVHAPGGRGTWNRNPAPKPFVNPGHLDQPWVNVCKGDQSLALLIPRGNPAAVQVLDFPEFVTGIMYSAMETGPHGDNQVEFALALNQTETSIKHLIAALGK